MNFKGARASARQCLEVLFLLVGVTVFVYSRSSAAPGQSDRAPSLDSAEGARQARELISEILSQRPDQTITNTGLLKMRDANDQQRTIPVRLTSFVTRSNWLSIYETRAAAGQPAWKLEVVHTAGKPNQYFLSSERDGKMAERKALEANATMIPFAGTDFWIADLGMEFFAWPQQRVVKTDMRHSRACKVLESTNPAATVNTYSKVVSWITADTPHGPVHADAYDANGKKLKEFDPKTIERLHGSYQLRSVEMRNLRTGSGTILEFDNPE